jgi:hypothetical protein
VVVAIPPQYATPENEALRDRVDADAALNKIFQYERLTPEDFRVLGMFVQLYNSMELNLRRCVEIFAESGMLSPQYQKRRHKLHTAELVPSIKGAVQSMDARVENIQDSLARLDEIELRRSWRNMISHWAARRIPDEDALLMLTKDDSDGRRAMGSNTGVGEVQYAIIMLPDLRGLVSHLLDYDRWLGLKTSEWYARYTIQSVAR